MHLKRASSGKIEDLIDYLAQLNFELLVPIHCTGRETAVKFKQAFGEKFKF